MAQEPAAKKSFLEKISAILLVLTILLAFGVGVLWQRLNTTASATPKPDVAPLAIESLKQYAKDLKLDTKKFNSCLDDAKYFQTVKDNTSYAASVGVTGTPAFFINGRFLGGAFPYDLFKEIIDKELDGKGSDNYKSYSESLQTAYSAKDPSQRSFEPKAKDIQIGNAPVEGNADAKVTIVEFSDFECPYCGFFYSQTLKQLRTDYIETGKVKFAFITFPLIQIHKNAQKAAEASLCANEQGKFWQMHDTMFEAVSAASAKANQ